MSEKKDELVDLVMNENVSAIQILVDRLGITSDEAIELINELLGENRLNGTLTEDGTRFFKTDVKLSEAPTIERDNDPPDFTSFNSRPGIVITIIGFIIVASGVIANSFSTDAIEQNFAAILILVGIFVAFTGLYLISKRKTPA